MQTEQQTETRELKEHEITQMLRSGIQSLKIAARAYAQLDEGKQRATRHTLYQQEGKFAKAIISGDESPLQKMIAIHEELEDKGKEG